MKNGVLLAGLALAIASFAGMMRLKADVETLVIKRRQLVNTQISLREDKRVLEAEMSYLSHPRILQNLASKWGYTEIQMTALQEISCHNGGTACPSISITPSPTEAPHVAVP